MTLRLPQLSLETLLILLLGGATWLSGSQETVPPEEEWTSGAGLPSLNAIVLKDQFGSVHSYHFPLDRPMVLLAADKKGYEVLAPWIKAVRDRAGRNTPVVGIADVRGVPGFLQAKVRRKFEARQKHPVLLDWDGDVLNLLNPEKGVPNAYLITASGQVVLHLSGEASAGKLEKLLKGLEALSPPRSPAVPAGRAGGSDAEP